jgi:hypothetical protein
MDFGVVDRIAQRIARLSGTQIDIKHDVNVKRLWPIAFAGICTVATVRA